MSWVRRLRNRLTRRGLRPPSPYELPNAAIVELDRIRAAWEAENMSLRTITIEVKINIDDKQYEAARKLARRCAQQLHAGAMLLSDKRVEVAVYGKDFHTGQVDIPLTEGDVDGH